MDVSTINAKLDEYYANHKHLDAIAYLMNAGLEKIRELVHFLAENDLQECDLMGMRDLFDVNKPLHWKFDRIALTVKDVPENVDAWARKRKRTDESMSLENLEQVFLSAPEESAAIGLLKLLPEFHSMDHYAWHLLRHEAQKRVWVDLMSEMAMIRPILYKNYDVASDVKILEKEIEQRRKMIVLLKSTLQEEKEEN